LIPCLVPECCYMFRISVVGDKLLYLLAFLVSSSGFVLARALLCAVSRSWRISDSAAAVRERVAYGELTSLLICLLVVMLRCFHLPGRSNVLYRRQYWLSFWVRNFFLELCVSV
jgi:hypothetical protein